MRGLIHIVKSADVGWPFGLMVDTGMATGNGLAALEAWLAHAPRKP